MGDLRESESRHGPRHVGIALWLLLAAALVVAIRLVGFEWTFVGDDVVFPPADAQYHLRRALYTFTHFPRVLLFDSYINYPGGASVPWPPLFDFLLGAVARGLATTRHGFEVVVALAPTGFALLTVWPLYLGGRRACGREVARGRKTGVGAVLFFALLPISVTYTRLGNADHHAAVAFLGAWLLVVCMAWAEPGLRARRIAGLALGLWAVQTALLLTWHGSLLYLALGEGTLLLIATNSGDRRLLVGQAAAAMASLLVILAMLAASPTPLGGDYSSIALSRLHAIAMGAVGVVCLGVFGIGGLRRASSVLERVGWLLVLSLGCFALLLSFAGPREGLLPALQFLTVSDGVGHITGEQAPLFAELANGARASLRPGSQVWGLYVYGVPLLPLIAWWATRRAGVDATSRAALWVLLLFSLWFAGLALLQRRYGNDLGPSASILFAIALLTMGESLARRFSRTHFQPALATVLSLAMGLALFSPAIYGNYAPRVRASLAALRGDPRAGRAAEKSVASTLTRFLHKVRAATPESAGDLDPSLESGPEYGVLAHPNLGHAIQYVARRATATDPFWAYIGPTNWERSMAFLNARAEPEALKIAESLRGRYILTQPEAAADTLVRHLHQSDGLERGDRPPVRRIRLVLEAEAGPALGEIFRPGQEAGAPYKLFEIVPGALIEVAGARGEIASAEIDLQTASGRRFRYRQSAPVGEGGIAPIRVPYASDPRETIETSETNGANRAAQPVSALGPYWVSVGGRGAIVSVPEAAVLAGTRLSVAAD